MLTARRKSALAKFLVSLYKMKKPDVGVSIRWLPKYSNELGYTYRRKNTACIYINANQDGTLKKYFDGLDDNKATMFITGVAIHEFMHQILTNFVLFEKILNTYKTSKEKKLFQTVFNIFEDSRIESFAPSYFSGEVLAALNYSIMHIWEKSENINPEDSIITQVINAMIMYGDIGVVKPELSSEAQDIFDTIIPLFDAAMESKSCAICLTNAKKALDILIPYADDISEDDLPKDSTDSDSTGEDAEDSLGSSAARSKKIGKRPKESETGKSSSEKEKTDSSGEKSGEESDDKTSDSEDDDSGEGASKEEASEESAASESGDKGAASGDSHYLDGCEDAECESFDDDPEEVEDDSETSEADFEAATKAMEETLKKLEKAEEAEEKENESDYAFGAAEHPRSDRFVKTISHHKAAANEAAYESYKNAVATDAHELAKLIKRQFKTKPGRKKRADHGDLNLMRYKDPNFRSPLIFDKKKPHEKHCAAVMLLVDESGSMGGRRIENARLAAIMLAEAMGEAGVPCCIVGHSGDSKYDYSVELEHYTTFKNTPADRRSLPMITARCQNRDGPAIRWASSILKKRTEKNKLMIIISDGQPCADSYSGEDAIFDTKAAIRDAKRNHDVIGIVLEAGSATDILRTMYGSDYIECNSAKNLKSCIEKIIIAKCKNW